MARYPVLPRGLTVGPIGKLSELYAAPTTKQDTIVCKPAAQAVGLCGCSRTASTLQRQGAPHIHAVPSPHLGYESDAGAVEKLIDDRPARSVH